MSRRLAGILMSVAVAALSLAPAVVCAMPVGCHMAAASVSHKGCALSSTVSADGWKLPDCHQKTDAVYLRHEKSSNALAQLAQCAPIAEELTVKPVSVLVEEIPAFPPAVPRFLLACNFRL